MIRPAGHTVENIDQPDEHEAGAALLQRSAARCHGGDDNERGEQSSQRIEDRNVSGGARQVFILGQIRAIDDGAVARDGQGEERLTEGKDPDHGVRKALGIKREDVLVAFACARGRNAM